MTSTCNDLPTFVIPAKLVPVPDQARDDGTGSRNPDLFYSAILKKMNYSAHRTRLVDWIRRKLIGPSRADEVLSGTSPGDLYPTGVLYPVIKGEEGLDPAWDTDEEDCGINSITEETGEASVKSTQKKRRYIPPSSVGFSFFVEGSAIELQILCKAATYIIEDQRDDAGRYIRQEWKRKSLTGEDGEAVNFFGPIIRESAKNKFIREQKAVFNGKGGIDVLWRPFANGWLTTVTLFNSCELSPELDPGSWITIRNQKSLFQVDLRCIIESGSAGVYPRVDDGLLTLEEKEIELQYRDRRIYAVGHGASADWKVSESGKMMIRAEFLPKVEVPQMTADVAEESADVLSMTLLAGIEGGIEAIFDGLDRFVDGYALWVSKQEVYGDRLSNDEKATARRMTSRMNDALVRMRAGIALLRTDMVAAESFKIANIAMYNQMSQWDRTRGVLKESQKYRWRPFQLAFLLTVIESVVNEDHEKRDVMDLIWFPTGGGKTEAYLGLIAFLIVWRRLKYPATGGGTSVIMRYTLRLLTSQQYLRAVRMICALELIRRKRPELGMEPVTAGMWVGNASSPNTFESACKLAYSSGQSAGDPPGRLVLTECPWCRSRFRSPDNYISTQSCFQFICLNEKCAFSLPDDKIPCNVVDQALYEKPPSLLIATIDKFARLAWDERTNAFFGKNGCRPPEMIIQDELHLISGALGSVAGLYESALNTVLIRRGVYPKYIASTATIHMADQQVKRLYGRKVAVFPPPGLSCDDSYFARSIPTQEKPGRLYMGYLAPLLDRQHCLAPLAGALLLAPQVLFGQDQMDGELLLDAWWTLVVYHGSLKGVSNSAAAFDTGVQEVLKSMWLKELSKENNQADEVAYVSNSLKKPEEHIPRLPLGIRQLTSIASAEENAVTFARLEKPENDKSCIDAVLATNMISVGLDVARLALMVINGQPLTTAEYIQASSRIGRGEIPGLVVVNYYRDQTRSISHYENFRPYHESFYRFVEPSSITPYTYQTRSRALHAALVIALRHSCAHLLANSKAGELDPDHDYVRKTISVFKNRCALADPERAGQTHEHIQRLINEWHEAIKRCGSTRRLDYHARDRATAGLLRNYDETIDKGLWGTLQSMRNVEETALLKPL